MDAKNYFQFILTSVIIAFLQNQFNNKDLYLIFPIRKTKEFF